MKTSLRKKSFVVCFGLIFLGGLIFSSILLSSFFNCFKEQQYQLLYQEALDYKNIILSKKNNNNINNIFLVDLDRNIKINNKNYKISKNIINNIIKKNKYKSYGNLEGILNKKYYILALPVYLNKKLNKFVFVLKPGDKINYIFNNFIKIYIISFILIIFILAVIILILINKIIDILDNIIFISKKFLKKDFRKKLDIKTKDELGKLALVINNMATLLEEMDENRRNFVSSVSHELKTPMTIISSSIEGILDGVIKEDQVKNYLVVISDEIKRLSKVVTSMNNLTKITSGQMKLSKQKINISEMIRQAIFNFEIQILNKNIKIFGLDKRDLFVIGDSDMIYQVIYNLIENAVKFVDQNGYIKIKYKETQELVYIGIKNSGEGISENDIKYICDKFYKVDKSRSQDKSGVGLGLYLVRQILRLHESDLEIESVKDKYTQFFFWLEKNK